MKISSRRALVASLFFLLSCGGKTDSKLGLTDDLQLSPCGDLPNCVSSDENGRHGIEPLRLGTDPATAWEALVAHLESDPSFEITVQEGDYLRAVARTRIFRFQDDVEFHLRSEAKQIAMRSASRIGLSDLGKNRGRLESIRRALAKARVLSTSG